MLKSKFPIAIQMATFIIFCLCLPNIAHASWTFDSEQCSPLTQHEVRQAMPPSVMIMVDRSGSMTSRADSSSSDSRWVVAKRAVDKVTFDNTKTTPNKLEFGFGMYQGSRATIYHEVMANANSQIMGTMNSYNPTGGTPTAEAIQAMYNSATVRGTVNTGPFFRNVGRFINQTVTPLPDSTYTGESTRACGFLWLSTCYNYDSFPAGPWVTSKINIAQSKNFDRLMFDVQVENTRGLYEYEIELRHAGKTVVLFPHGTIPESQLSLTRMDVVGFENHDMKGVWELRVRDRFVTRNSNGKFVPSPGNLISWGLNFDEKLAVSDDKRASAGILITDGYPNNASSAVVQACKHRDVAPLYMIGLGSNTDTAFNNILAAAGGTGSCTSGDVCTNPSRYNDFRGTCSGSYQANNAAALGVALSSISSAIACTYPLSVLGGGTVPKSNLGCEGYDCVYVSLDGGIGRIYHEESTNAGPKGWSWASETDRKFVKLNATYCGLVQSGTSRIIDTQVACLCSQPYDAKCDVFDPDTCECPTGRWTCDFGTDVCQPSPAAQCNTSLVGEGDSCSNGKLGICEEFGYKVCGADGRLGCSAGPGPAPRTEVCNGLDDDCNGIVDDVAWEGIAACHVDFGRNTAKIQQETIRCNIGHASCVDAQEICVPLLPMPEICNGLDDDCDALIDNLSKSNNRYNVEQRFTAVQEGDEPAPLRTTLTGDYAAAACFERDVCVCPTGSIDITSPEYMSDNYDDYLETYWHPDASGRPTCLCSSGLTQ